jgi:hypothetical protein
MRAFRAAERPRSSARRNRGQVVFPGGAWFTSTGWFLNIAMKKRGKT